MITLLSLMLILTEVNFKKNLKFLFWVSIYFHIQLKFFNFLRTKNFPLNFQRSDFKERLQKFQAFCKGKLSSSSIVYLNIEIEMLHQKRFFCIERMKMMAKKVKMAKLFEVLWKFLSHINFPSLLVHFPMVKLL